jgi:hypothetical protein
MFNRWELVPTKEIEHWIERDGSLVMRREAQKKDGYEAQKKKEKKLAHNGHITHFIDKISAAVLYDMFSLY